MSQDNKDFTLEDILAEQRAQREAQAAQQQTLTQGDSGNMPDQMRREGTA